MKRLLVLQTFADQKDYLTYLLLLFWIGLHLKMKGASYFLGMKLLDSLFWLVCLLYALISQGHVALQLLSCAAPSLCAFALIWQSIELSSCEPSLRFVFGEAAPSCGLIFLKVHLSTDWHSLQLTMVSTLMLIQLQRLSLSLEN